MPLIDLRSDTLTKPSAEMREAMAGAEVGDDVYGEDPTVNSLESRIAELLGHEAGLFTPTGSLANQLGMRLLVNPGEEILADVDAHVLRAELGAAATFSGITSRTWHTTNGIVDPDVVINMMRPNAGPHLVSTTAIAIENTHNFGGGTIQSLDSIFRLRAATKDAGISMHLDGARLWNAHVAAGIPMASYAQHFDTVSVCLSKGLGAPIGSVLVSSKTRIANARVWRKRYGAGMRQVGVLAAAGHYALDNNIDRLADDHRRARAIAKSIASVAPSIIDLDSVMTNIIVLNMTSHVLDAPSLAAKARELGIVIGALGPQTVRLITHLDITDENAVQTADVMADLLR
ncbi:MAG TPA: GntG family PLP-dependent aldolase [Candidatus Nanopelagicaceae bacterium]|nr:GntG family PLP-dependent aldolase [Candidatus Nanopelagicaceae bacterium]